VPAGSIFGYDVVSELPLARLAPVRGSRGELSVLHSAAPLAAGGGPVVHRLEGSDTAFALTRAGDGLHVACSVSGTYLVEPSPGRVTTAPEGPAEVWEHRLLSTVLPLLLAERGDLVVHGSAVESDGRAVVFLGRAGRGKSTLALAAATRGHPVLAEDGAVVAGGLVWPGPLGIRVAEDVRRAITPDGAFRDARAVVHVADAAALAPVRLGALVVLGERTSELAVERLAPAAAVPALVPNLIFGGADRLARAFSLAVGVAGRVPIYRCSLAGGLDRAAEQVAAVLSAVAE
jgi:hypothetical protein